MKFWSQFCRQEMYRGRPAADTHYGRNIKNGICKGDIPSTLLTSLKALAVHRRKADCEEEQKERADRTERELKEKLKDTETEALDAKMEKFKEYLREDLKRDMQELLKPFSERVAKKPDNPE